MLSNYHNRINDEETSAVSSIAGKARQTLATITANSVETPCVRTAPVMRSFALINI